MLTDGQWVVLEPLVQACRSPVKVEPSNPAADDLSIFWRHQNGAKRRALPEDYGPWWVRALPGRRGLAAQTFLRRNEVLVRHLAVLVAAMAPKPV